MRFDHVSLTVRDRDRSVEFYTRCFGFRVVHVRESAGPRVSTITGYPEARLKVALLELGGVHLELIEYENPKGKRPSRFETKDVGTPHVAIATDDIAADYERLQALGVQFKSAPQLNPNNGDISVYGVDIDGIPIELAQRGSRP